MTEEKEPKKHVSFSEIKVFDECAYRWYLIYDQGHRQGDTVHTIFGSLIHKSIDDKKRGQNNTWISFGKSFLRWAAKNTDEKSFAKHTPKEWVLQGFKIYHEVFDWLEETFPKYELVQSELQLFEKIENIDLCFKGFIDLVIKDKDGFYHVIDFKTTDWGWDAEKKSDTKKLYQVILYKKFFCQKYQIDPKLVKTHYVLLKRNPSKNSPRSELFTISSGEKKVENATEWLQDSALSISKKIKMKNRYACKWCPFKNTKLCP